MKILIIDGNPTILNMFKKLLEINGFFVTAETTFDSGLQHLENKIYNVIFIDVPLSHHTEKQILTSLKKNNIFQKTNVFLFSSIDFNDVELDEWKKAGLYSYLKKPVKRSIIIKVLEDIRTKSGSNHSQLLPEPEQTPELGHVKDTTEHLEKLNQLQKQIQKLKSQSEQTPHSSPRGSLPKESAEEPIQELEFLPEPEQTPHSSPRGSLPKESAEEPIQELEFLPEPEQTPHSSPRGSLPKESAEEPIQELEFLPEPEQTPHSSPRGSLPKESAEEPIQELEFLPEPEQTPHSSPRGSLPKESAEEPIQELEFLPEPEQTPHSSPRGSLPKESAEEPIQELEFLPEPEQTPELGHVKDATEHLEKLNQLQKQIQKLQNIPHQHTFSQKNSQLEKSIGVVPESVTNIFNLKNTINNLKSLQSTFESIEQPMKKPFGETDVQQDEIIKKQLGQILFELSKLKNEIQLLDEIDDSKLKYDHNSSNNNKKHKKTKKSARIKMKKHFQIKDNKKSKN